MPDNQHSQQSDKNFNKQQNKLTGPNHSVHNALICDNMTYSQLLVTADFKVAKRLLRTENAVLFSKSINIYREYSHFLGKAFVEYIAI
jgi:hypothetical protein